ncbi:ADP,ATP carrier protein 1 [Spatholobus suberectus]|nr:ADP,ATP carrier protein 1 [Spatholobus suberectus]
MAKQLYQLTCKGSARTFKGNILVLDLELDWFFWMDFGIGCRVYGLIAYGWGITIGVSLATYPIETMHKRMMMTCGEAVKYKSSLDAFKTIIEKEGIKLLFKGVGANILCVQ